MRWIVTGANGMLGQDLVRLLEGEGESVVALGRPDLDITSPEAVATAVQDVDIVVNCAAHTAVDLAETDEPAAFMINAAGPSYLAAAARRAGARMIQFSTDYVLAGMRPVSGAHPEDAPLAPASAYGRTKAAGEWAVRAEAPDHLIIRVAWLYGEHGGCFPKTIARAAGLRETLDVVEDQIGQPTWTVDVADLTLRLVRAQAPTGTYHGTSSGEASWYEFAREIVESAGFSADKVLPTTSEAFVRPAPRPSYSALSHQRLIDVGVHPIGPWRERWAAAAPAVLDQG